MEMTFGTQSSGINNKSKFDFSIKRSTRHRFQVKKTSMMMEIQRVKYNKRRGEKEQENMSFCQSIERQ